MSGPDQALWLVKLGQMMGPDPFALLDRIELHERESRPVRGTVSPEVAYAVWLFGEDDSRRIRTS